MSLTKKRFFLFLGVTILSYFLFNAVAIYYYSFEYSEKVSDVAIVLGAGTKDSRVSPVFRERINHSLYLYKKGIVKKIIFTGGYGEGKQYSDSQVAKLYALTKGIPSKDIIIEEKSKITLENLLESKTKMDSLNIKTALLISDPLHMKRAMSLAINQKIDCHPSPTQTSMYKSILPKTNSLFYETFYYSLGKLYF